MANLAIKGHKERGKEVIELLEMLGGERCEYLEGNVPYCLYNIDDNGFIDLHHTLLGDVKGFTLEQFLEKFPYKVGDKVRQVCNPDDVYTISDMIWNGDKDEVEYRFTDDDEWAVAEELEPYKEQETMEETDKDLCVYDKLDFSRGPAADKVELVLGDYEIIEENGKTFLVKKKPKYPKTYEGCCKVVGVNWRENQVDEYFGYLLSDFQRLLICRNAYWKIAGDWKPDYTIDDVKFCIVYSVNLVVNGVTYDTNQVLVFPTEEMRDAFFENFEELINECKELL